MDSSEHMVKNKTKQLLRQLKPLRTGCSVTLFLYRKNTFIET